MQQRLPQVGVPLWVGCCDHQELCADTHVVLLLLVCFRRACAARGVPEQPDRQPGDAEGQLPHQQPCQRVLVAACEAADGQACSEVALIRGSKRV